MVDLTAENFKKNEMCILFGEKLFMTKLGQFTEKGMTNHRLHFTERGQLPLVGNRSLICDPVVCIY